MSGRRVYGTVRAMSDGLQPTATDALGVSDWAFMGAALAAAWVGAEAGEVPVGAVLVQDDAIVSVAHNAPIGLQDPTAHAEVLVLRDAARQRGNYRLVGATVYVTAEPCVMCVGALAHARVRRVVYGCPEPKAGALGSLYDLTGQAVGTHRFAVTGGVRGDEAAAVLREFFRVRRGA